MKYQGLLVTSLSGAIAGVVASHNKGGPYFRARANPTQPNTPGQADVKARMASLAAAWLADLTPSDRIAWDLYGENTPVSNALGESIFLTGQNWYVGNNVARLRAGLARVDTGPTTFGLPELSLPTFAANDGPGAVVGFTNTDEWASAAAGALIVQIGRPQNASVHFYKSPFVFLGKQLGNATPPTTPYTISSGFPYSMSADQAVFARIRAATADGRLSAPVILRVVVTASG